MRLYEEKRKQRYNETKMRRTRREMRKKEEKKTSEDVTYQYNNPCKFRSHSLMSILCRYWVGLHRKL